MAKVVKTIIVGVLWTVCGDVVMDCLKPVAVDLLRQQSILPLALMPSQPLAAPDLLTRSLPAPEPAPPAPRPVAPPAEPEPPAEPTPVIPAPALATLPEPVVLPPARSPESRRPPPPVVPPASAPPQRGRWGSPDAGGGEERWREHWQDRGASEDREPARVRHGARGGVGRGDRRDSEWVSAPRRERLVRRSPHPPPAVETEPPDGWPVYCGFERPCSQRRPRPPEWRLW